MVGGSASLEASVRQLLTLPRGRQVDAALDLLAHLPEMTVREEWNTAFGPGSLFEAWSRTTVARGVYAGNVEVVRPLLDSRPDWVVVEVGAGNGELWRHLLRDGDRGTLVAIDPVESALEELGRILPPGVRLDARPGRIEEIGQLPDCDAVICALTLHHCAGRDAQERARHGFGGAGKLEVLQAFASAVEARSGQVILCEADIHCEVDLPSGSALLRDRLLDSYVRRCGRAILADLEGAPEGDLADRWRHILRHWCVAQIRMADVPVAERDVYELDVGRWYEVLERAGLSVVQSRFTDEWGLFHQYVCESG